jgi:preprotein translocase subunit SecG
MEQTIMFVLKIAFVLVAALMSFLILLQEGKGGGLAALGGTKAASVEGVTNPIRRATGYLAAIFFLLAIILGCMAKSSATLVGQKSKYYENPEKEAEEEPAGMGSGDTGKKDEAAEKKDEAGKTGEDKKEGAKREDEPAAKEDEAKKKTDDAAKKIEAAKKIVEPEKKGEARKDSGEAKK